jgi:hypothetical protein
MPPVRRTMTKQGFRFLLLNMLNDFAFVLIQVEDEELARETFTHLDAIRVLLLSAVARANQLEENI